MSRAMTRGLSCRISNTNAIIPIANRLALPLSLALLLAMYSLHVVTELHGGASSSPRATGDDADSFGPPPPPHGADAAIPGAAAVPANNDDDDDRLPSCEGLMRRPLSPYADGQFLSRRSTRARWRLRSDTSRELELPDMCRMRRYSSSEARTCLKDRHVMFVGDSLSRYQYLSLAHLLERGTYPPRFRAKENVPCRRIDGATGLGACSKPDDPNVCAEGDWAGLGGWPAYQRSLGGGDDGGLFRGRMESHSTRECKDEGEHMMYVTGRDDDDDDGGGGGGGGLSSPSSSEGSSSSSGGGTIGGNGSDFAAPAATGGWKGRTKLSYSMEFGWSDDAILSPGWKYTGCAYGGSCRYTRERYDDNIRRCNAGDVDWKYPSVVEAFGGGDDGSGSVGGGGRNATVFLKQHADVNHVFYNRGLWGKIPEERARRMMKLLRNFTTPPPPPSRGANDGDDGDGSDTTTNRCFYKSTTGCPRSRKDGIGEHEYGAVRSATFDAGCEYMDVAHLTEEFAHFLYAHPPPPGNVMSEHDTIFWDLVHYQPWVYEELNNLLLNVLCNNS